MTHSAAWLLLIHSIPPKPPYLRAKVMRRLTHLGALALKRSAYLLPADEAALEDFQWLRQEIRNEGGDAWIVEGRFVGGLTDEEIRDRFREMRAADYRAAAADARALLERVRARGEHIEPDTDADRRRIVRRLNAIRELDFFDAEGRDEVEVLMATIDRALDGTRDVPKAMPEPAELQGRLWATRAGIKVDRMASAWLIRRFIDPAATFVFVDAKTGAPPPNALRFDMYEGEFTHDGNRCTFEVLLEVCGRTGDRALVAIAQMVHDLDLRDDRYQRPETAGVAAFVSGIAARFDDDHRRVAESTPFFDTLYASLGGHDDRAFPPRK